MTETFEDLKDDFELFEEEQKRQLICAISSHTVSFYYPEKGTHFKQNLEGLDKSSLEWLTQFLTLHIKEA